MNNIIQYIISGILVSSLFFIFFYKRIIFRKERSLKEFYLEWNGMPSILFLNTYFSEFTEKIKYPYHFQIHIEILKKNTKGLPEGRKEIKNLDKTENLLNEKVKSSCNSYFIGRITNNGFRYLIYYINDGNKLMNVFKQMQNNDESLRKFYTAIEKDEKWEKVVKFENLR